MRIARKASPTSGTPSRKQPPEHHIDVDNSAMQVIGGSHHHAQLTFRDSTATENNVLFQTVDNAAATDPVRDASLSHHRQR